MQNIITVAIDASGNKSQVVREIIKSNFDGKIFRAVNVKADGNIREYRAMLNVTKHVKGVGSTTAHKENLMTIYDMGMASELGAKGLYNPVLLTVLSIWKLLLCFPLQVVLKLPLTSSQILQRFLRLRTIPLRLA